MATVKENKKNGKTISFRFTVCLERDVRGKQIRKTTTWIAPADLTPAKARKAAERAADAWEEEVKAEYQKQKELGSAYRLPPDKRRDDFVSFVNDTWFVLQIRGENDKPNTIAFYKNMTRIISEYFKGSVLQEIGPVDIQKYLVYLRTEYKSKLGKPLSAKTLRHQYGTLNLIFGYAEQQEMIAQNPLRKVNAPKKEKKPVDAMTKEQAERFFKLLPDCPMDFHCIMQLLITTGIWRGECMGLQWGDINEREGTMSVERSVAYTPESGLVINPADFPVSITANRTSMTGSGTVKLTVTCPEDVVLSGVTCSDDSIEVTTNANGTYSAYLPNVTKAYTFTVKIASGLDNYSDGLATCTVSVTRRHTSSVTPGNTVSVPSTPNGTVTVDPSTASKGETVRITTKPSEGYELGSIEVLDKNGDSLKLKDLGNGKYSFVMPDGKVSVEAEFVKTAATSFADVPANAYFADAVNWAVDKGITNGLSDTTFGPYESCTRAQIVTFLWRAAGSPEPKAITSAMTDLNPNAYYYKAVLWAIENGITDGMTETTFAPNATCTRGQSVTFLHRTLKGTASGSANFTDVKPDAFYADAVNWAVASDVTNGTSNTTFSPNADCTRAEIVTFLYRAYQGK